MTDAKRGPQRTCVACRQTKDKSQLVRYVVAPNGAVLVDYRQRLPGRGAYTCVTVQCVSDAVKRNSFQRCFKGKNGSVDAAVLMQQLSMAVVQKFSSLIGMSRKSGQIIAGSNAVIEALRKKKPITLVLIAEDISVAIGQKVEALAQRDNIYSARLYDKQMIGQMLGKEERSVIAIPAGLLADSLLNELHRYRQLVREN